MNKGYIRTQCKKTSQGQNSVVPPFLRNTVLNRKPFVSHDGGCWVVGYHLCFAPVVEMMGYSHHLSPPGVGGFAGWVIAAVRLLWGVVMLV